MIRQLGLLQLALLGFLVFVLAGSLVTALLYPRLRSRRTAGSERRLQLWAAAPLLSGLLGLVLCFLPALLSAGGLGADHCPQHDDHHAHFCWVHLPASPGTVRGWLILAMAAVLLVIALVRIVADVRRGARLRASLLAAGHPEDDQAVRVETERPVALTLGLWRPRAFLSRVLFDSLQPDELGAVLAHERAHAEERDLLWLLVARLFSVGHLPAVRRQILADLVLAQEIRCDAAAARAVGDPATVARAIVAMERLHADASLEGAAAAFQGSSITARIEALLEEAGSTRKVASWRGRLAVGVVAVTALVAGASQVHHAAETLLEILIG